MERPWHARSLDEILAELRVDPGRGLDPGEARRRLAEHGPNKLPGAREPGLLSVFFSQFKDIVVLVLIGAACISAALGEAADAAAVLSIVILNAALGCAIEYRAGRSLAALKAMAAPIATVRRGGQVVRVRAEELVPGDVVLLKEGDRVPADARLFKAAALGVDESPLTGESIPAGKDPRVAGEPRGPAG